MAHKSAAAARQYYAEGLKREDYYSEGQEIVGKWHGKAAEKLGLKGDVTPEAFAALVENRHPLTGKQLTPRNKADRIVGYDINFHAPKSLSVLHALTGDSDILKAFRSAVAETMAEIEEQTSTRVRQRGAQENRNTGNLAWAEFIHFTARPVGGIPDPHLHCHAFCFNATFDSKESRWKAAKFRQIKQEAPYNEAAFHARLASKIAALGYATRRTKDGWEVDGISRAIIDKFSRRTAQIERLAEEKGIKDAKAKDALGASTREGKRHGLNYSDLLAAWGSRLTESERAAISKVRFDKELTQGPKITPTAALDDAIEKMFAKNSVVELNRLVAEGLRYGVGHVKPDQLWRELSKRQMVIRKEGDQLLCTTLEVLREEVDFINKVRNRRGNHAPLRSGKLSLFDEKLSAEQRRAVQHVLSSTDQVIALRGGAGVGKTTLMKEAATQIEAGGQRIFAFAPSAAASRETLREAGFESANTVAHLLTNKDLQLKTRGQVIWIDEAGLLGMREMAEILKIAGTSTRVILTGDSAQHAPVARGDAFRLLQQYAGLKIAEVTEIRRQEQEMYKQAVAALSRGDLPNAFRRLDELGAIVEVKGDADRYRLLAQDFMSLSGKGAPPLVVSPTHAESAKVTEAIREAKKEAGQIKGERSYLRFHDLQWENPDKRRAENYRVGLIIQFHQNAEGIRRGELLRVSRASGLGKVFAVNSAGKEVPIPLKHAERFQVFEEREIRIGKGDQIRITRNGESKDKKRLNNGNLFTIKDIKRNGDILLSNGATLSKDHGHFNYGYCQTSHSSQSKSVRDVLVVQSEDSFVASSREQFYVSVSRGKQSIRIYTDDRSGLQEAVGNSSIRKSGIELAGLKARDIAAMDPPLSSRQFAELIQSRKTGGTEVSYEKALLRSRKQPQDSKKPDEISWRKFVEMKRGLSGPDGKSRSKGSRLVKQKKGGTLDLKKRSFLRPTELTKTTTDRMKAAHEAKKSGEPVKSPEPPKSRLRRAYDSAAEHFNRIMGRRKPEQSKDPQKAQAAEAAKHQAAQQAKTIQAGHAAKPTGKERGSPLPRTTPAKALDHSTKQKALDAAKALQQAVKQAQQMKAKQPAPPPPAPRK